jgi:hypothetical protein
MWTAEIIECTRTASEPGAALREHLRECSGCRERREDERRLSAQINMARDAAALRHHAEARRKRILAEFDASQRRSIRTSLKWAMAAVAVALFAIGLSYRTSNSPKMTTTAQERTEIEGLPSTDSSGFVAVPYAPPLATGEFVRVVRTELLPTALARMGIDVDADDQTEIPADVMVGEDGFPRAVRLVEAMDF